MDQPLSSTPPADSSLVKVDFDMTKPATTLIERISEAIGGTFRPAQIERVARAEAKARIIEAEADIQVRDLLERAERRRVSEEARRQRNIERIAAEALPMLDQGAHPEKIDDDWIVSFFEKCRHISDADMQGLWSRILAGEANAPGSFSRRTIGFLGDLDSEDAKMFATLCRFCCVVEGESIPVIVERRFGLYLDHGLTFDCLNHLESIGLIRCDMNGIFYNEDLPKEPEVSYFGKPIKIVYAGDKGHMYIGQVIFTATGEQLAPICHAEPIPSFYEYLSTKWVELVLQYQSRS